MTFLVLLQSQFWRKVMAGTPPTECCIFRHCEVDDPKNFWAPSNFQFLSTFQLNSWNAETPTWNICTCLSDKKSNLLNQVALKHLPTVHTLLLCSKFQNTAEIFASMFVRLTLIRRSTSPAKLTLHLSYVMSHPHVSLHNWLFKI